MGNLQIFKKLMTDSKLKTHSLDQTGVSPGLEFELPACRRAGREERRCTHAMDWWKSDRSFCVA